MSDKKSEHGRKKSIAEIGSQVPSNLKFGIIVAVALFWAEFLRSVLTALFNFTDVAPVLVDFILALIVSGVAYLVLLSYRKLQARLKKIKV